jgi:site-specific recombinase XerD
MWIGELSRRNRSAGTLDEYRRRLNLLADDVREAYVHQVTLRDYERFLDRWLYKAPSTMASAVSLVKGFSEYLWERGYTDVHVAHKLRRPRRARPEDLDGRDG